jgi:hypothetical protein
VRFLPLFLATALFAQRFEVSFPSSSRNQPADGRLYLVLSTKTGTEPRFQIDTNLDTQQFFGVDVDGLEPGKTAVVDAGAIGYPRGGLKDVPPGEYTVQALLNIYETFHLADGRMLKLPPDQGEGQKWNEKPGNLYSEPRKIRVDSNSSIRLELTKSIPPVKPPPDTKYVKHLRIESKLLSAFWGRPVYLGAIVLLPDGFDEHPGARYPVLYYQGHFSEDFVAGAGFSEKPPGPKLKGNAKTSAEFAYKLYQDWTSGRLPHMLIVVTQHANPFYDDSYAVNSANLGPYGDALVQELYPYVEKKFRAIGEPWARVLYGGSTGGWETLAQQVFYPDYYNGAWCSCPDPIDFHAYQLVDLYNDKNAYYANSEWKRVPVPAERETDGRVRSMMDDANRYELVLGTRGRSTEQFDIWQAVYSPPGDDGYPKPIFDKSTGVIDRQVAEYWKEHYDLNYIMRRDWRTLGPKLVGKIHMKVGDRDTYYLDRAVRLAEEFLESTKDPDRQPYYAGDIEYGAGQPHCYTGDPTVPARLSRFTINQRLMPEMQGWMLKTAPRGADVTSWRY